MSDESEDFVNLTKMWSLIKQTILWRWFNNFEHWFLLEIEEDLRKFMQKAVKKRMNIQILILII